MFGSNPLRAQKKSLEQQIHELSSALAELKSRAAQESESGYAQLKDQAGHWLEQSHAQMHEAYDELASQGRRLGRQAKQCAQDHPVGTAALGVAACAVIGWLLLRR